jgi:Anti-sigma factor NepR
MTEPTSPSIDSGMPEPEVQNQIGRRLQAVYDEALSETMPDRFARLLAALKQQKASPS